ncbi:hypothetical protein Scep_025520 [Stephania cephalantha]|uniref:1-phosphatidylinositol 4-kinase n=1 Tax=Stephania cephalantha TaxID=152367 RepID=A0AAP0HRM9_9MAGN
MSIADVALTPICDGSALSPRCFLGPPVLCSSESIVIYVYSAGSMTPMRVLESESIASVKLRIQSCNGFVVKKPKLVFGGRELARNNSLVRDYGVADGNVLHLAIRLSDLQFITVKTVCGKKFEFHVERYRNVGYVKHQIAKKGAHFVNVKDQELICDGEKLDDLRLIDDICKKKETVIHLVVQKSAKVKAKSVDKSFEVSIIAHDSDELKYDAVDGKEDQLTIYEAQDILQEPCSRDFSLEPVIVNPKIQLSPLVLEMIKSTRAGLERGKHPVRSSEGSGGAYFMQDSSGQRYISVFKPIDEEPMAVRNPCGLPISSNGEGLKRGTRVGEGAFREVAAFILDHPSNGRRSFSSGEIGFSGVPPTAMIKCLHQGFNHPEGYNHSSKNIKIGSLQMFMENNGSCEDMGPRSFPLEEVHKISVLDIRLANADRHAGNILISKDMETDRTVLIPIDHGYCLPENFEDCTFDWLYWPQAKQPYNLDTVKYIMSLDAEEDIALLKFHGWDLPLECARVLRISTLLLKKGVQRGLTPFEIGSIMCSQTVNKESTIEEIVREAQDSVLPETSEVAFLDCVSEIMDRYLDNLAK